MDVLTDRELLELAAKAIGKDLAWSEVEGVWPLLKHGPGIRGLGEKWNPLTDDGDALRLAVDLELEIHPAVTGTCVGGRWIDYGSDKHAATRRATVLAAAEIGREK